MAHKTKIKPKKKKRSYEPAKTKVLAGGVWKYPLEMPNDIALAVIAKQEALLGANINTILCDALRKGLQILQ
jgi:hypothetical protein